MALVQNIDGYFWNGLFAPVQIVDYRKQVSFSGLGIVSLLEILSTSKLFFHLHFYYTIL